MAFIYSSSVFTCFAFDGGVGLEGEGNGERASANEADKQENTGIHSRNARLSSKKVVKGPRQAVVKESGEGVQCKLQSLYSSFNPPSNAFLYCIDPTEATEAEKWVLSDKENLVLCLALRDLAFQPWNEVGCVTSMRRT